MISRCPSGLRRTFEKDLGLPRDGWMALLRRPTICSVRHLICAAKLHNASQAASSSGEDMALALWRRGPMDFPRM